MTRIFDGAVSLALLVLLAPLMALLTLAVRLSSPGPALFRQTRVGRDGVPFQILMFRTMVADAEQRGAKLTGRADARITPLGRRMRRAKLDELPQLWNVVRGEMALIGPRPEDPHFVAAYDERQRGVLRVRPGILGISQIVGRNEEDEYPDGIEDLHAYYLAHILPDKLERDLAYVEARSFAGDLLLLARGVWAVLTGGPGAEPRDREQATAPPGRAASSDRHAEVRMARASASMLRPARAARTRRRAWTSSGR